MRSDSFSWATLAGLAVFGVGTNAWAREARLYPTGWAKGSDVTTNVRINPDDAGNSEPRDLGAPLPANLRLELAPPTLQVLGFQQKLEDSNSMSLTPAPSEGATDAPPGAMQAEPIDLQLEPIDYNKPDPNIGVSNHFRALGGVVFANYVNWQFAWLFMDMAYVTRESIARNFRIGFIWDDNSLQTNFFRHPYQGSMYYHAARGAGLPLWESALYTAFGSMQWEFMGETHPPAPNDFYTTTLGGIALGEMLYRLSSELLDDTTSGGERFWRELGAAALAPMRGFQRLTSGQAWAYGPPHESPSKLDFELDFGIDHVRRNDFAEESDFEPSFLFAMQLEYGDQLPHNDEGTFDAYDFFDAYVSATLFNSDLSGGRAFVSAILGGWNQWLSDPDEPNPDNNVVGFSQSFDYANANLLELGSTGVGVADWANWRFGDKKLFRLNADVQWIAMSGATTPFTQSTGRTYNFGMGLSGMLRALLRMAEYGDLSLFAKQYVVTVVDGEDGSELYGLLRGTYELPVYRGLGLGVAPTWVYRYGNYKEQTNVRSDSVEAQAYILWKI